MNLRQAYMELGYAMEYADEHPNSFEALGWVENAESIIDRITARKEKHSRMMKADDVIIMDAMKRKAKKAK